MWKSNNSVKHIFLFFPLIFETSSDCKIIHTLARGPLNFEALGKSGTGHKLSHRGAQLTRASLRRYWTQYFLSKTCSVLCVQPRVDNGGAKPLKRGVQLRAFGQIGLRPVLYLATVGIVPANFGRCELNYHTAIPLVSRNHVVMYQQLNRRYLV